MNAIATETAVGVLSGLILAGLGWFTTVIVVPWVRDLTFQGARLQGHWLGEFEEQGAVYRFDSDIVQRARKLRGTTVITRRGGGRADYRTEMTLTGRICEGFVSIDLACKDPACLSTACGLFKIEGRGGLLAGWLAYRTSKNDDAAVEKAVWEKLRP